LGGGGGACPHTPLVGVCFTFYIDTSISATNGLSTSYLPPTPLSWVVSIQSPWKHVTLMVSGVSTASLTAFVQYPDVAGTMFLVGYSELRLFVAGDSILGEVQACKQFGHGVLCACRLGTVLSYCQFH